MRARKASTSSKTMTLRLDPGTLRRLDELAQATYRSRAWLAAQAVRTYLDLNEWQIKAIREAVERADRRGTKFLTHDEVETWLATWGTSQEPKPPSEDSLARRGGTRS
jgi:predicted transcriptional regulator